MVFGGLSVAPQIGDDIAANRSAGRYQLDAQIRSRFGDYFFTGEKDSKSRGVTACRDPNIEGL